jgi:hypothetical protein
MSSPINDNGFEDRLKYAPPWARRQAPKEGAEESRAEPPNEALPETEVAPRDLDLPDAGRQEITDGPPTAPRAVDQPGAWLRAPARVFEGDLAMRELRTRMTLDPQLVPEPPQPSSRRSALKRLVRLFGITAFAAGAAYLVVLFAFPGEKKAALEERDGAPPPMLASTETDRSANPAPVPASPVRLALVESRRALVNEPVPLGVTLTGALDEGAVIVSGLAAGARLSTGAALGAGSWRVPVADLAQAAVGPPRDFIGAMDLAVELRSADDSVTDRSTMRIEWAPANAALPGQAQALASPEQGLRSAAPPARPGNVTLDREEIATLVKRGRDFIANGDLASARLVLRRAADGGDAQAALLLGSTYDPATFKQLKVIGSAPDPAQARAWYQRAADLGSAEAVRRLEPLAQGAR